MLNNDTHAKLAERIKDNGCSTSKLVEILIQESHKKCLRGPKRAPHPKKKITHGTGQNSMGKNMGMKNKGIKKAHKIMGLIQ